MNIEKSLAEVISQSFKQLFDHTLPAQEIELQDTRKEFEGNLTLVVFPFLRVTKKKPEETAQLIGEYVKENSVLVTDFNVISECEKGKKEECKKRG